MDSELAELLEFLRFQSISTSPLHRSDVADCAAWLHNKLQSIGLETTVHTTPGHPVVVGKTEPRPDRRTVLIYGHYDVQPVDPMDEWKTPPFDPQVADGIITARGATDNKGQIFAHILGVQEALITNGGELPVNVIFLIEGEEEIGSPNLAPFLRAHRDELRCDVIAISDTGMVGPKYPALTYSLRGIAGLEIRLAGPAMDLHSGIYGGAVLNPIGAMVRMLAGLHDDSGRVAVPGFYDDVMPLHDWEKKAWADLPLNDARIAELTGVPALFGEAGYTAIERIWGRPTIEINGIGGGYQGDGTKTVIPREAFAKLTCRLVPNQDPQRTVELIRAHLQHAAPEAVKVSIDIGHSGAPFFSDPNSTFGQAARRALHRTWNHEPALIREGGSIPILQSFREILGVEVLLLGLALPDCRAHSPNENFPVENFTAGIRLNRALLEELAT